MQSASSFTDKKFRAICLVLGQLIVTISSFFWQENGRHTINGSVLVFFSMLFLSIGFIGLFDLLRQKLPLYSKLGFLYAMYGIFGGTAFAFEGLYSDIFNISDKIGVEAARLYPVQMNLVLFWSGPAFPLSLLILGIVLARTKTVKWWVGTLLSLGGITFPISRILRIEWLAHLNDILLLGAFYIIASTFWYQNDPQ